MNVIPLLISFMFGLPVVQPLESADISFLIYNDLEPGKPSKNVFDLAYTGYSEASRELDLNKNKPYLTIIDFSKPSTTKRLWVVDLERHKILYNTYVAHGRNSGSLYARKFSNKKGSLQSSLGFFLTGATYYGKNGYSMYLDGLESDINSKARDRAIVMHGAWYATEKFIKNYGRLGRSFGCPAVPPVVHKSLINLISDKTILFIYSADQEYIRSSRFVQANHLIR